MCLFQLTHPWGCDSVLEELWYFHMRISTHTPVRVWRLWFQLFYRVYHISTHTPVRVWLCDHMAYNIIKDISTHTPVRVWLRRSALGYGHLNFNSHTREGVTLFHLSSVLKQKFQLTHPWGCDNGTKTARKAYKNFNSHTREGVT